MYSVHELCHPLFGYFRPTPIPPVIVPSFGIPPPRPPLHEDVIYVQDYCKMGYMKNIL